MQYRHEYKFLVNDAELRRIARRLAPVMKLDKNQTGEAYTITSLYFDDIHDRCLYENLDGVENRNKYRIRIYDRKTDVIKLEKKSKLHGFTSKQGVSLTVDECAEMVSGRIPSILQMGNQAKKLLLTQMKTQGLFPKSIVEYDRTAYTYAAGNVRITFDRNIRGSRKCSDFLRSDMRLIPLLPEGVHVLEVKYDEFLPRHIYNLLDYGTLRQTAFSKYMYSRKI